MLAGALELVDFAGAFVSPELTSVFPRKDSVETAFPIFSNFPIINT